MRRLGVVPFAAPPVELGAVARALESEFPLQATLGLPEVVPTVEAYDTRRNQYLTRPFLETLVRRRGAGEWALGLTDVDLYVPELHFVFGEADRALGCAVVSVARLAGGLAERRANPRWHRRVVTEAVHEVGHLFGLPHCADPLCAMFLSNTLADTDRKSPHVCARCAPLVLRPGSPHGMRGAAWHDGPGARRGGSETPMAEMPFDEHAEEYDAWFLQNRNILQSEVLLLTHSLAAPGRALSVGCGSGLFEYLLRTEHDIAIGFGLEPAEGMARIAERRGLAVQRGVASALPFGDGEFDTVLLNGTASYVEDLGTVFGEANRVLKAGGHIVVADVPAESSYGMLYQLAAITKAWDDPDLQKIAPRHPYPLAFAMAATWRTTEDKAALLRATGFADLEYAQTLTRHPKYSNDAIEMPVQGFERGDYVAIRARKR